MCFVYYKAVAMAHCAPLLKLLAAVAPNTALPIRKLELALSKERPSTLGAVVGGRARHLDEEWSSRFGTHLRIIMSMFRQIKKSKKKRYTCLKKATTMSKRERLF